MKKRTDGQADNPVMLLLSWAGRDRGYLLLSVLCSFFSGLCVIVPYLCLYRLMDTALQGTLNHPLIVQNVVVLLAAILVRYLLFAASIAFSHKGAYGALFRVRCRVIDHMAKVPLGALSRHRTGDMKTILNEDIEKLEQALAHNLPDLVHYLVGPLAVFIYLLSVNVPLALVSLIPLAISLLIMGTMFGRSASMMERCGQAISNLNSVIIEYINGMRLVKAYNMGSTSFAKFSSAIDEENDVWNVMSRKMGPPYAAFVIIIECGLLLLVPLGGLLFLRASITVSVFLLFAFIGSLYLTELRPLQELGSSFAQSLHAVVKAKELLDIPVYESGAPFPSRYDIELRGVGFSYDDETPVLRDCNLKINQGEKVALIGRSGAGKTTIAQLIARSHEAQQGTVLIGGRDVRALSYGALLRNIAVVFQKTFLSRASVLENIRMGSNATFEQVRNAARAAQIDDFIMRLPQNYDTEMGGFGTRFSGGEKQRIAIARAIVKDAPILILDEATSAADPENQVEIDKALANLCRGRTVLVVAHRLSVVNSCDRVAVIEDGEITGCGTHADMLQTNGYYRAAWADYNAARKIEYEV
jgi:ATP-binding cassette subfamily B protein